MGIAFSNAPIIPDAPIDGTSAAAFKSDLHAVLVAAGWSPATVTGGYKYTLTSPQTDLTTPLECCCRVTDGESFGGSIISVYIRFESTDGLRQGRQMILRTNVGRTYEAWVGQSQLFLSYPDHTSDVTFAACAGGVPFVPVITEPDDCAKERVHTTTEAWWSMGNGFRYTYDPDYSECSACYNGVLTTDWANKLSMGIIAPPEGDYGIYIGQQVQWHDDRPLLFDPMLIWERRMRGQIWDAIRGSKHAALDAVISTSESGGTYSWRNWMNHRDVNPPVTDISGYTYHTSLYLLQSITSGVANIAY